MRITRWVLLSVGILAVIGVIYRLVKGGDEEGEGAVDVPRMDRTQAA